MYTETSWKSGGSEHQSRENFIQRTFDMGIIFLLSLKSDL